VEFNRVVGAVRQGTLRMLIRLATIRHHDQSSSGKCAFWYLKKWTWFPSMELGYKILKRKNMSNSLLYHAFGLGGYRFVSQKFQGGQVTFRIDQPKSSAALC
jgi:hypothetical protein